MLLVKKFTRKSSVMGGFHRNLFSIHWRFSRLHFLTPSLILIWFFVSHCKKHNTHKGDELPPITEEGKNTFGCKVNGKVWIPYYPCFGIPAGATQLSYEIRPFYDTAILPLFFSLRAGNSTDKGSGFFIGQNSGISDRIFRPGNVIDSLLINFTASTGHGYYNFDSPPGSSPREFIITKLDTAKRIVSGTFAFTLYSDPGDSVVISDGRFDLQIGLFSTCTN